MKKNMFFWQLFLAIVVFPISAQAQSLSDLFNKVGNAVSTVTNKNTSSMEGNWSYSGPAIEFKSDNLLGKAGGALAATAAEQKLSEQLAKFGIESGKLSFTFKADSTFIAQLGSRKISGSYSYETPTKKVNLKIAKMVGINAQVNCTSQNMDLLFDADKLFQLITYLSSKSNNSTLNAFSTIAQNYDGMMLGLSMSKQ